MARITKLVFAAIPLLALVMNPGATASAQTTYPSTASSASSSEPFTLEQLLPDSIAQNLDVNVWGWMWYQSEDNPHYDSYRGMDMAVGATQRVGDDLAFTTNFHYLNDDEYEASYFEQAFATLDLCEQSGTLLTVGKFHADIGAEPRDQWDRLTGTTSLLFGAEPQDMVGIMLTQPIGQTGLTVLPFLDTNFEGGSELRGGPAAGVKLQYQSGDTIRASLTNWIGPGVEPMSSKFSPFLNYGYLFFDWEGPAFNGSQGGTLYFTDANVQWNPRPDWTLAAEGLLATDGPSAGTLAWSGLMFMANYDLTDRWRLFGQWSDLNDARGLIAGLKETRQALNFGVGYEIMHGLEISFEYRHDFARSGGLDTLSSNLTFSY